jgi:putative Holliday junction resolvase
MPDSDRQTFVAFDFGMKRIGIAVGQTITHTATPLTVIKAQDGIPLWPEINAIISEWSPHALIVGVPLNMDGTEQELTFCARRFANRLRERFGLPVHSVDERLTTREARLRHYAQGNRGGGLAVVDSIAAQIILESWLSQQQIS